MFNPHQIKILRTGAHVSKAANADKLTPLVHIHVPKCAGTTLDEVLLGTADAWERPGFRFYGTIFGQGFSGRNKAETWKEAAGFEYPQDWLYASGHIPYGRFPAHGCRVNEVCIIRDPLSRLISMFNMGVDRHAWSATTPIRTLFETGQLVSNSMVRQLSGETSADCRLESRHLEAALRNFENVKYRGRMEAFDLILGAILADFAIPYVAYHSFQVRESVNDLQRDHFAADFSPYMELDQIFFDRAIARCPVFDKTARVTLGQIEKSAPVLLVSPALGFINGEEIRSAYVPVEDVAQILARQGSARSP